MTGPAPTRNAAWPRPTRRALLFGGAAAGGVVAWQGWRQVKAALASRFDFVELASPEGFRLLSAGDVSTGRGAFDALAGLPSGPAPEAGLDDAVAANPCLALFGPAPLREGVVPVAAFSDYNCPYCRVLTKILARKQAEAPDALALRWHEWPLFGEVSEVYARAALAADRQGAYPEMHARLMRTRFVPNAAYLERTAEEMGLNPARLLADLTAEETEARIAETRALARLFGFPGTPALVVGRTAVIGAVSEPVLDALIARERAEGPPLACA